MSAALLFAVYTDFASAPVVLYVHGLDKVTWKILFLQAGVTLVLPSPGNEAGVTARNRTLLAAVYAEMKAERRVARESLVAKLARGIIRDAIARLYPTLCTEVRSQKS